MAVFEGFIGPSARGKSRSVSIERSVNVYLEQVSKGTPKSPAALYGRPGLQPYATLYAGPVRALFAQDGRCFAVGGGTFNEILPSQTVLYRGAVTLIETNVPASIASNGTGGNQLMVVSGGHVYIYDLKANTLTLQVGPPFPQPIVSGVFYEGAFVVLDTDGAVWFSAEDDGTSWDGLDFFLESQSSDITRALTATHNELWLYGEKTTAPWLQVGEGNTVFQPVLGSLMQVGTAAPFSATNLFNTAAWIGRNNDGSNIVYLADGYQPTRISTHAVEHALGTVTADQLYAAQGFTFQYEGHSFLAFYVPGLESTWIYDLLTQEWVEWAHWVPKLNDWIPFVGSTHAYAFGQHLFGDRQSPTIYSMSAEFLTDKVVLPPNLR